jgi:hypothetical protein
VVKAEIEEEAVGWEKGPSMREARTKGYMSRVKRKEGFGGCQEIAIPI